MSRVLQTLVSVGVAFLFGVTGATAKSPHASAPASYPSHDVSPEWAPDGRRLAFARLVFGDYGELSDIEVRLLTNRYDLGVTSSGRFLTEEAFSWAPDSRRFVVRSTVPQNPGLQVVSKDGEILVSHLVGASDVLEFAWSTVGEDVAFVRGYGSDLMVGSAAGTPARMLASGVGRGTRSGIAWSPDGRRIAFVDATGHVATIGKDAAGYRKLTAARGVDTDLAWAKDGTRIVFSNESGIWVVGVDGTGLARVTDGWEARWSPNSRWILFARGDGVWRVRPDGTRLRHLAPPARSSSGAPFLPDPVWSPDGKRIAYVGNTRRCRRVGIFVATATGKHRHRRSNFC